MNYFERHLPFVGYFSPLAGTYGATSDHPVDRHLRLIRSVYEMKGDASQMVGQLEDEAARLIAGGKTADLLDRMYANYAKYKESKDLVLVTSPPMVGEQLDAQIASALGAPVLLAMDGSEGLTAAELYRQASLRQQLFREHKVPFLGAIVNKVPQREHAITATQLRRRFNEGGVPLLGVLPDASILRSVRLDEVKEALGAEVLFSSTGTLDEEYSYIIPAAQRLADLLDILRNDGMMRPLVVTTVDRLDLVLGLMGAQVSANGPGLAGVLLCPSGHRHTTESKTREMAQSYFDGIKRSGLYKGFIFPVMAVDKPMYEVLRELDGLRGAILPSSTRKIKECQMLFDAHVDANALVTNLEASELLEAGRVTPKMFSYQIRTTCAKDPQTIVLPEATDSRVLLAASMVSQRGLAKVILLGDPAIVANEAKKAGADISGCAIVDPQNAANLERYVGALIEARRKKGISREAAVDQIRGDVNSFGVMMVATGDADGMVSGAIHTTAATIRPAMQVLKTKSLVSSVFFMCLPDKVLVYGDCAVNVSPSSQDLAQIASVSADTAAAFGLEPRVAMLSYSTLGSGAGPDVQKVTDAVQLVHDMRPDLKVEGPIQYDAAIDPAVAAVKIKTKSEVAGRANVFVFPDLNTGNNTYKAVQQATGAIAMGPVMQGLSKPVNDLSRGCTVADIINTICVTSVQAIGAKALAAAAAKDPPAAAAAAPAPAAAAPAA
ncbi:MAG: phosphate acetyltransferase [Monoraphidium minutum]|nr:MAG: phosphate acetyltransferase [Monoraphidium minutum]